MGDVSGMFKTKRQRRERALRRWSDGDWGKLPEFLVPFTGQLQVLGESEAYYARVGREKAEAISELTSDPAARDEYISEWLDESEKDADFARKLDRHLGLPTGSEEVERHAYNKRLIVAAGFVLAVILAIWKLTQ